MLAAALAAGVGPAARADAPSVPTATVQPGSTAAGFELDGALQPVQQSTVAAQVAGNVLQLAVKAGDRVKAGQLLARIDEREARAGLARSDAAVTQAEAELRNAQVQVDRTRELRTQGFVSQSALDVAETQLKAAQAALQQAQAGRTQAALARGFTNVTAPFDGVVLATHVEAGDLASPGRPIAAVYMPGALRAVVQVPASRAAVAHSARRVEVQLPRTGRWIAPTAVTPLPIADAVSQTVEWRLDLPADVSAASTPGQTVRVRFLGGDAAAVTAGISVPADAVLRRGELTAVYVVQNGRFVLRPVRTGSRLGDDLEVLAGLQPGDRVATDPVRAGLAGAVPAAQ
jgi:RND family efflux transporter MFP subunit